MEDLEGSSKVNLRCTVYVAYFWNIPNDDDGDDGDDDDDV